MASLHYLSNSAIPIPREQAEQMLESLTNAHRETGIMVQWLVAHMDRIDGDADREDDDSLESDGDDRDGSMGEDDFCTHPVTAITGPGCPVADPGGCEHDDREIDDGL